MTRLATRGDGNDWRRNDAGHGKWTVVYGARARYDEARAAAAGRNEAPGTISATETSRAAGAGGAVNFDPVAERTRAGGCQTVRRICGIADVGCTTIDVRA